MSTFVFSPCGKNPKISLDLYFFYKPQKTLSRKIVYTYIIPYFYFLNKM